MGYEVQQFRDIRVGVSLRTQFRGLFIRNWLLLQRSRKTLIFQIGLPSLFVLAICMTRVAVISAGVAEASKGCTYTYSQNGQAFAFSSLTPEGTSQSGCQFRSTRPSCTDFMLATAVDSTPDPQAVKELIDGVLTLQYSQFEYPGEYPAFYFVENTADAIAWASQNYLTAYNLFEPGTLSAVDDQTAAYYNATMQIPLAGVEFLNVSFVNATPIFQYITQGFQSAVEVTIGTTTYSAPFPTYSLLHSFIDENDQHFAFRNVLHNAYLNAWGFTNISIQAAAQESPYMSPTCYNYQGGDNVVPTMWLYSMPILLSLSIPVFLSNLVRERQHRYVEMMKMSGMKTWVLWAVNFIFDVTVYFIGAVCLQITLLIFQVDIASGWNFLLMLLLFGLWGMAMVSFCYFLSCFFTDHFRAMIFGYILVIVQCTGVMVGFIATQNVHHPPLFISFFPFAAFFRGCYYLSQNTDNSLAALSFLAPNSPFGSELLMLMADTVIYMLLALYLDAVLPRQYGVAQGPCFCVSAFLDFCRSKRRSSRQKSVEMPFDSKEADEGADCRNERARALDSTNDSYVSVRNLTKYYRNTTDPALDNFCLTISQGECLALLGPNGAGKSTLISVLSGLYEATSGDALVGDSSIATDIRGVHSQLGVCPQYDILWDELSVREHILFSARLKGVPPQQEYEHVAGIISDMGLEAFEEKWTEKLSPGIRRRVSIGMALAGSPRFLVLDEPTTALDPQARRDLWDVLMSAKIGRCTLLATHSMEEAEMLSTRIAIMTRGRLKSIGSHFELKRRLGSEYKVRFRVEPQRIERLIGYMQRTCPQAQLASSFAGLAVFTVPKKGFALSSLFASIEKDKFRVGIKDWGVALTSLEEVFVAIVKQDEGEHHTAHPPQSPTPTA